jgi:hypothetical protein
MKGGASDVKASTCVTRTRTAIALASAMEIRCAHFGPGESGGPPMMLGNVRANGVRSIAVSCWQCHHEAVLSADRWPGHMAVRQCTISSRRQSSISNATQSW